MIGLRRQLECLRHGHYWTGWERHQDGCGTQGCDHYLRRCVCCQRWQHKLPGGRPRVFKWGGLFPNLPPREQP